ncbi:MAG: cytochrome P450 [Gammaproteobacteria bacterium]|nr:cytochrome P450 [Gammaproteobacteria bacterium]MBK7169129.1 cytochrome P450 [Gammaproteobacteria bacterium]
MNRCPARPLLDFANFTHGTPRASIDELRDSARLVWESDDFATGGHWLVLQQADIDHVLKTPKLFSNREGPLLDDFPPAALAEQQQSMTFMDPPEHRKYRSLVDYAFRLNALKARKPAMRRIASDIIDQVIGRGECEFISEVAMQLPMQVMYKLLGVQEQDYRYVVDLTNTLALADDPEFAENRAAGFQASMQLIEFGARLAADHRLHPRDSMTMEVLAARINGQALGDREFGRFFNNLIVGGMETTRNTLALGIHQFILHPEQYRLLQQDPALVPAAVEEILRFCNTVVYLRRTATRDMEFAGENIRRGDKMVCVLGAPNRDAALFADPARFDITRNPANTRRHYRTFGQGPHYCIGVHQARLNLEIMLEEIARRLANIRLLAAPRQARSLFMDGFKEMRIAFDPR